jgi:hypothetical protein
VEVISRTPRRLDDDDYGVSPFLADGIGFVYVRAVGSRPQVTGHDRGERLARAVMRRCASGRSAKDAACTRAASCTRSVAPRTAPAGRCGRTAALVGRSAISSIPKRSNPVFSRRMRSTFVQARARSRPR